MYVVPQHVALFFLFHKPKAPKLNNFILYLIEILIFLEYSRQDKLKKYKILIKKEKKFLLKTQNSKTKTDKKIFKKLRN